MCLQANRNTLKNGYQFNSSANMLKHPSQQPGRREMYSSSFMQMRQKGPNLHDNKWGSHLQSLPRIAKLWDRVREWHF